MKKILFLVWVAVMFLSSSCATMDHWLYGASDYFIREDDTPTDSEIYWDDFDWDLGAEEYEYD